jgi:broad specificity phosphatase PhoE
MDIIMRIGLVRHFKVDLNKRRFMTAKEYDEHVYNYDRAGVIPNELVVDSYWEKCYCSNLSRAITTAKTIYHGEIIISDKLIEVPAASWVDLKFRMPYYFWTIFARFAWIRHHVSQPEKKAETLKRLSQVLEQIISENTPDSNILIVSHAGALYEIKKLLRKRGFKGRGFIRASNGKLYIFDSQKRS